MVRVTLTDRFVAHARPGPAGRGEYFDAGTTGLALRVSEGGKKTWSLVFTAPKDGKRARLTLGTYPAVPLSRARSLALEAKAFLNDGVDPREALAAKHAGAVTVGMLADAYLVKHVRPNLRSAANFEQRLTKNVKPIIGSLTLAELHPRDINRVLNPIIRRSKPTEANCVFENMRAMFRWAVRRGDLDRNPMDGMIKPGAEGGARERVLSDDEIRHLWNALPQALVRTIDGQRILKLCLITGQRVGEVAGMRVTELDLTRALWAIPGSRTKNATPHSVPLSDVALDIIEEALKDAGKDTTWVFPSGGASIDPHAIGTAVRRALAPTERFPKGRLGMARWTPHDLRRTALTGLAQLGVAPIVIGSVANHLSVTKASVTFAHYVQHDYGGEKRAALDLWAERLEAIISGAPAKVLPLRERKSTRPGETHA